MAAAAIAPMRLPDAPQQQPQQPQQQIYRRNDEHAKQEAQRVLRTFMPRISELMSNPNLELRFSAPVLQLGFRVKRLKKRHMYLFNGVLVITRSLAKKQNPRWIVALSSRKAVSAVIDSQYFIKNVEFRVYSPMRTFTFFANEPSERDTWIRLIEEEMQEKQRKA